MPSFNVIMSLLDAWLRAL